MTSSDHQSRTWLVSLFLATAAGACGGQPFSTEAAGSGPAGAGYAGAAANTGSSAGSSPLAGSANAQPEPGNPGAGGNGGSDLGPPTQPPAPTPDPLGVGGQGANITDLPGAGGALGSGGFELIDDLEGNFPHLPLRDGRSGSWYMVHDETGGFSTPAKMLDLDVSGSQHAVSISGSGFTSWGVQLAVALKSPAASYDASSYCGIRFKAAGTGGGWTLLVSDRTSIPAGGICGNNGGPDCYDFVGKRLEVGEAWKDISISFDELGPLDPNAPPRLLDAGGVFDIIFNFWDAKGGAFSLAVDDLSFIEPGPNGCP